MEYLVSRFLSAFLSGLILSQTGSYIQMSTRNVLASPSTLGFDGLAILWVLIFHSLLVFYGGDQNSLILFLSGIPVFIFVGWIYSRFIGNKKNIERLILIGLTFNLLVGAIFSLWQFLFLAFNKPFPVELWFGHFRFAGIETLLILLSVEALILFGHIYFKRELKLFSLGPSVARNLKLKEKELYLFFFIAISIGTFSVIALFGAFSFLGLILPFVSRKLWFKRFDLSGEFLMGAGVNAFFFMLIDVLCYYFPIYGAEIPVGLIATGLGAVSLILLLWKSSNSFEILAKSRK